MKEAEFIGALMPSHPDLQPIIQEIREKYQLPEVDPKGDPITEIYLDDKQLSFAEFLQDVESLVETKTDFLPLEFAPYYKIGKSSLGKPLDMEGRLVPDDVMAFVNVMYSLLQSQMSVIIPILDNHFQAIAHMLYVYLLTGESEEVPEDWISKVFVAKMFGVDTIQLIATQTTNPEVAVQQFREIYKKTFGKHTPKLTKTIVSTAYYLQLKRLKKPWDFIVEEYIRLNKFSMPRDNTSTRYIDIKRKYAERLKKQMQRSEVVLNVLIGDKKQ